MAPGVVHALPYPSKGLVVCFCFCLFPFYSSPCRLPHDIYEYPSSQHMMISGSPYPSPLGTQIPKNGYVGAGKGGLSGRVGEQDAAFLLLSPSHTSFRAPNRDLLRNLRDCVSVGRSFGWWLSPQLSIAW